MSQLTTLIWLKWALFRNSLRSSKAKINRIATGVGMLIALVFSILLALGLGAAAYALTWHDPVLQELAARRSGTATPFPSTEIIFFSMLTMCYLLWATLPLSIGASRQFDPGNLLLYPISLQKLFAIDLISEIASIQSIFAIPAIVAIGIGAGLAQENLIGGILISVVAAAFGISLSKWVATSIGALVRRKRTRGEMLLALIGAAVGLGGALFGQVAPSLIRYVGSIPGLRWTPPGALALALTRGLREGNTGTYVLSLAIVIAYTVGLVVLTFWLARRAVLSAGRARRARVAKPIQEEGYIGWNIPVVSEQLAAIIEKELRYIMRNAQVKMMALMPLILIAIRLVNRQRFDQSMEGAGGFIAEILKYGEGIMASASVLYVFLILSGLSCNLFAFEHAGMRTLILAPVERKRILVGKNLAVVAVAFVFSVVLLVINQLVFRDLTSGALLFAALSFVVFAFLTSVIGNWCSIYFPKRMKFGTRQNVSGVVGLLLIPTIIVLALIPFAAVAAGILSQSMLVEYATLAVIAVLSMLLYLMVIGSQGESLQKRELNLLEAVTDPGNA